MTPYAKAFADSYSVTNALGQVSNVSQTGMYSVVSCATSNRGNMVKPTNWYYLCYDENRPRGVQKDWQVSGPGEVNTSTSRGRFGVPPPHPPWDNRNTAYNLALSRLNGLVRGELDLSVALAESGTTARMLKSTGKLLKLAGRLKPPGGFGSTKDVANGYLQWKYGWSPLLGDIFGAANEALRVVINKLEKTSARGRVSEDGVTKCIYPSIHGVPNVPVNRTRKHGDNFSSCTIGVAIKIPDSAFQLSRWTSMNPVSIAYELIPYSFVVDWVFDIGSYLRDFETACLYSSAFDSGYVSEIHRVSAVDEVGYYSHKVNAFQRKELIDIRATLRRTEFRRTSLSSYPFPRRPTIKVDLSSSQMLSAAALLRQLLPDGGKSPERSGGKASKAFRPW